MSSADKTLCIMTAFIVLSTFLFGGEPDVKDAIVHYLMNK